MGKPRDVEVSADERLAARAILISLVVLGHNHLFRDKTYYFAYIVIYSFHVGAFFVLSALSRPRAFNLTSCVRLVRTILVPFVIATTAYGIAFAAFMLPHSSVGMWSWLRSMVGALVLGTTPYLDAATGLKMLWFLPAFAAFCLTYNMWGSCSRSGRRVGVFLLFLSHGLIGLLEPQELGLFPMGFAVVLYLMFPSLLFTWLHSNFCRFRSFPCILAGFAVTTLLQVTMKLEIILSDFLIPSFVHPLDLMIADCQLIFGTALCLWLGRRLAGWKVVQGIGRQSMLIYLFHAPFNVVLSSILQPRFSFVPGVIITVAMTIFLSVITSIMFAYAQSKFRFWFFENRVLASLTIHFGNVI